MRFRFLLALGLVLVGLTRAASPDQDPTQFAKLVESRRSLEAKKPQEALQLIEEVIAFYDRVYRDEKAQLYCARTQVETVRYLVGHVAGGKPEAGPPAKKAAPRPRKTPAKKPVSKPRGTAGTEGRRAGTK